MLNDCHQTCGSYEANKACFKLVFQAHNQALIINHRTNDEGQPLVPLETREQRSPDKGIDI